MRQVRQAALAALRHACGRDFLTEKRRCSARCTRAGVYEVAPASGVLAAGASQAVTLRFSPLEVEDVGRSLVCHMPALQQLLAAAAAAGSKGVPPTPGRPGSAAVAPLSQPLVREVNGKVRQQQPGSA